MPPLPIRETVRSAVTGVSWLALVAATSLGVAEVDCVRALVSAAEMSDEAESFRLIVQTYRADAVDRATKLPLVGMRPVASTQRSVTPEELKTGVSVNLVQLEEAGAGQIVVAWVEPGEADLEFDGLRAVPSPRAKSAAVHDDAVRLVLS